MRRVLTGLATVAATLTLAGCGGSTQNLAPIRQPTCSDDRALVLMAQSVPSAALIPCVRSLPTGWSIGSLTVRDGTTHFTLDSDRAGEDAVEVLLEAGCNAAGATRIPSDEAGTTRFERIEQVFGAFRGRRYYLYPGGCTTYDFRFDEPSRAMLNEVSLSLTFVSRATVDAGLRKRTDGTERL